MQNTVIVETYRNIQIEVENANQTEDDEKGHVNSKDNIIGVVVLFVQKMVLRVARMVSKNCFRGNVNI